MKVVELFAGVGGFRVGLERASPEYDIIWSNQWEPGRKKQYAFDCYKKQFKTGTHVNEDIALVKDQIPDHELLVGGFPCQDYSVARSGAKGIEGKKGVLWWHINDIINSKTPKYVLLENVDRLLRSPSSQRGRDFAIILRCLADSGYAVEWRVINAAEYGLSQRRRRIFIFAYHKSTELYGRNVSVGQEELVQKSGFFATSFKIEERTIEKQSWFNIGRDDYSTLVELSDQFSGKFYAGGSMFEHVVYTRECVPVDCEPLPLSTIVEDKVDEKYYVKDEKALAKWAYLKGAKHEKRVKKSNGAEYFYTEGAVPFPDPMDRPGRTMLTSEGKMGRCSHIIFDGKGHRILTPVECERLNGFRDNWTDCMPESARYFTMGNALVVPLVKTMGVALIEIDNQHEKPPKGRQSHRTKAEA